MRTEFRYISTKNELLNLSSQLKNVNIFAFDLERTIPGIYGGRDQICLIQISTRDCDFIIDTLRIEVHRQIHALLGDLFSNQNILKV
jgi:exosome complex exonuclease RRP6